jgi:hypothetical protein
MQRDKERKNKKRMAISFEKKKKKKKLVKNGKKWNVVTSWQKNLLYMYTQKRGGERFEKGWRRPLERDTSESMEDSRKVRCLIKNKKRIIP